ncbi:MAG: TauD/TfdA family dioxygenase [Burkholderiaceae bacterium]
MLTCMAPVEPDAPVREVLQADRDAILAILQRDGAILFRGYDLINAEEFNVFVKTLTPRLLEYAGGTSPRTRVKNNVYKSTEYPAEYEIAMHNEMSYHERWPDFVYFYCAVAPADRGETPIADSRKVLASLSPELVAAFEQGGVSYRRNLLASQTSFGSWQRTFETEEPELVEEFCRERQIDFRWGEHGTLHTREARPALRTHPLTGERVWFNQAHMWHISNAPGMGDAQDVDPDELPMTVTHIDGTPIAPAWLQEIRAAYRTHSMQFSWQPGDVLLMDNMLMAHGRRAFSGPREILVAMACRSN